MLTPSHAIAPRGKRLRAVVKDKQQGGTIEAPEQDEEPAPATDLMDALRKTLAELGH